MNAQVYNLTKKAYIVQLNFTVHFHVCKNCWKLTFKTAHHFMNNVVCRCVTLLMVAGWEYEVTTTAMLVKLSNSIEKLNYIV